MNTRATACAALLALAAALTTGCSGGDTSDNAAKPTPTPSATSPTPSPTPTPTYTEADCLALVEETYETGPRDVSNDPECAALTQEQYTDLVGTVIGDNTDEIMEQAETEAIWDTAWDDIDPEPQTAICDVMLTEGPEAAAPLTLEQAQYFLDNKC
ncbi:hypothetical protein AB0O01_28040 [Streptomyces sp. NPDC093252]|uniref:hypothetical protein n=1 Tax=Streptomyces sp. NPDC093252 TaxID=3154980 RepID=UPI003418FAAB